MIADLESPIRMGGRGGHASEREKHAKRRKKPEKHLSPIRFLPKGDAIHGKDTPANNLGTEK